jgi:hypothetical protein
MQPLGHFGVGTVECSCQGVGALLALLVKVGHLR